MTFRPSDDVLDEVSANQGLSLNQTDFGNQNSGQHIFSNSEDSDNGGLIENGENSVVIDSPVEEVKAPDLSELLKNNGNIDVEDKNIIAENENSTIGTESLQGTTNLSDISSVENSSQETNKTVEDANIHVNDNVENKVDDENIVQKVQSTQQNELDYLDSDKVPDSERHEIVSSIAGSISSNLDFLVDNDWFNIVKKYKKVNRLFFRWTVFTLITIVGILSGVFLQVKVGTADNLQMVEDSSIENKNKWNEESPDKLLSSYIDRGLSVSIPYGSVSIDGTLINSKSNLILYKGVVLPQLSSLDYNSSNFVSLENFNLKNVTRVDIEELVKLLITKDSIYKKTTNIPNANSLRWVGNKFSGGSLKDGFNLLCIGKQRFSDFICDKFLDTFYKYGKYYDLNEYDSELFGIVIDLKSQRKNIEPICDMIKEYTLRSGKTSDALFSAMNYCGEDDVRNYRKLVNFIDLENSLGQPTLSNKVFDDPDLNAYKLLSAQQSVYRILDGTSLNEGYIKSYLKFVQDLIDKDKGSNRYLHPIYKDILYVFNMDELYQKLMEKGKLSSELNQQIDQINHGNNFGSISLLSQLTTSDLVQTVGDFGDTISNQKTLEELFSQYYAMTDRLKIRKANIISEEEIKVQTEVFTDKILSVTDGQTLKVTLVLRRQNDLLYVDSIKIANQPKFTDILDLYLKEGNVTFYAMLNYIDEQVGMWYEVTSEQSEEQPDFCDELMQREDVEVYACDDSSISLYKGEIGYEFVLEDGVLVSFTITDENLENIIKKKLDGVLFMRDSTPSMITSIIDFSVESEDDNLEKKIEIIDQFRIHFKTVPNYVYDVKGKSDVFLVDFTLGDFDLQGYYDINTHLLTRIYYTNCPKPLEIKQLSLEITSENESQLIEILNNPRVFFANVNPLIYSKYKNACGGNTSKQK